MTRNWLISNTFRSRIIFHFASCILHSAFSIRCILPGKNSEAISFDAARKGISVGRGLECAGGSHERVAHLSHAAPICAPGTLLSSHLELLGAQESGSVLKAVAVTRALRRSGAAKRRPLDSLFVQAGYSGADSQEGPPCKISDARSDRRCCDSRRDEPRRNSDRRRIQSGSSTRCYRTHRSSQNGTKDGNRCSQRAHTE